MKVVNQMTDAVDAVMNGEKPVETVNAAVKAGDKAVKGIYAFTKLADRVNAKVSQEKSEELLEKMFKE